MNDVKKDSLPAVVADVRRRLEEWRRSRPKWEPIPASLWSEAAALARVHGVNPVAKALRLDYYSLKRQMGAIASSVEPGAVAQQAFVEVALFPSPPSSAECSVELERPDGARMRIRLSRQEDLVALTDSFWRWRA